MLFKEQFGVKCADGFLKYEPGNKNIVKIYNNLNDITLVIGLVKMHYQKSPL